MASSTQSVVVTAPIIKAIASESLDTVVSLALNGADLHAPDASGKTALAHAIERPSREAALALLLIATAKFTKPLPGLLAIQHLQTLQQWVSEKQVKNEAAMTALLPQLEKHLASGETRLAQAAASVIIDVLIWSARHGFAQLGEASAHSIAMHAGGALPLTALANARDGHGRTVLHALVLAGQVASISALSLAFPQPDAAAIRAVRDGSGRTACQVDWALVHPSLHAPANAALVSLGPLPRSAAIVWPENLTAAGSAPAAPAPVGVSGAVDMSAETTSVTAAVELLQFAVGGHEPQKVDPLPPARRNASDRSRPIGTHKQRAPYQRRNPRGKMAKPSRAAAEVAEKMSHWAPSASSRLGDLAQSFPPGRQPGEFAGWSPLAGADAQQQMAVQKAVVAEAELRVQELPSRDAAREYILELEQSPLQHDTLPGEHHQLITTTVDDSAVLTSSDSHAFRDLASWGGFRREYHREHANGEGDEATDTPSIVEARQRELQAEVSAAALSWRMPKHPTDVDALAAASRKLERNTTEVQLLQSRLRSLLEERRQIEQMIRQLR